MDVRSGSEDLLNEVEDFRECILSFYGARGRTLPWRQTTDPYRILVSELMLQQTQVVRVIPKYLAFLERFPTPRSLVDAPLADVLRLWQGLGYNRRAKYLKAAARLFLEHPRPAYEQLLAQKGIGPYTAAAVCVFAYNEDRSAIDVNVRRIFTRVFGDIKDTFIADALPSGRSRDWHNALMDFGSSVCTKRSPSCEGCPFADSCHAFSNDTFSDEPSASQPRFAGSVRWHRGRVLKSALEGPVDPEDMFSSLDARHADRERFDRAVQGLLDEGLIVRTEHGVRAPLRTG